MLYNNKMLGEMYNGSVSHCISLILHSAHYFVFFTSNLFVKMPKSKPSDKQRIKKYVDEFGENIFSSDGSVLFCELCETRVSVEIYINT